MKISSAFTADFRSAVVTFAFLSIFACKRNHFRAGRVRTPLRQRIRVDLHIPHEFFEFIVEVLGHERLYRFFSYFIRAMRTHDFTDLTMMKYCLAKDHLLLFYFIFFDLCLEIFNKAVWTNIMCFGVKCDNISSFNILITYHTAYWVNDRLFDEELI